MRRAPIFEADFSDSSYGARPGRSAHQAIEVVRKALGQRRHRVVDVDLARYFGAPGQAWRFQRVQFPPRQEAQPPHRESSLAFVEVTT
jgi:hypothetical protein